MFDFSDFEENALEFIIYTDTYLEKQHEETKNDQFQIVNRLTQDILSYIESQTLGFVWNLEPINLQLEKNDRGYYEIKGRSRFGDSIDDEWLIVWILYQISTKYPTLVISVCDNDGEFLLVEAALELPKWLKPENSTNRVFINNGSVHIIPPEHSTKDSSGVLNVADSIKIVNNPNIQTSNNAVTNTIKAKIEQFPAKLQSMTHNAFCILSESLIAVVKTAPQLVSKAVDTFYLREPISLMKMEKFHPTQMKSVLVKFNRAQYAKLVSQEFNAPPPFSIPDQEAEDYKAAVLGMKLMCGFEMLYSNTNKINAHERDSYANEFQKYISGLTLSGYFEGLTPSSTKYKEKLQFADMDFLNTACINAGNDKEKSSKLIKLAIDKILSERDSHKDTEEKLIEQEDDDSWMVISPDQLEQLLSEAESIMNKDKVFSNASNMNSDLNGFTAEEKESARNLQQAIHNIQTFLNTESSYEGAEFVNKNPEDEWDSDFESSDDEDSLLDDQENAVMDTTKHSRTSQASKTPRELSHAYKNHGTYKHKHSSGGGDDDDDDVEGSDEDIDIDPESVFESLYELIGKESGCDGDARSKDTASVPSTDNISKAIEAELSKTTIASTFVNKKAHPPRDTPKVSHVKGETGMNAKNAKDHPLALSQPDSLMAERHNREQDTSREKPNDSPASPADSTNSGDEESRFDESELSDDGLLDVDVDVNMVENLVSSFGSQLGLPGPAGVLFNQFGYVPPKK
ncbi:Protein SGT1 [Zancudomyces culisetae]|uniref:Protein SGT1 n=1 Tax=Zancudomyces culisetae TaxID=1213189 RepID=A0A1R1PMX0_ZANCU|nr:Protein SGT1 [Zancudomyces culisetae]|eukprot:OMH82308.1 Protein SGT1 [Zancudomyces culisetae]